MALLKAESGNKRQPENAKHKLFQPCALRCGISLCCQIKDLDKGIRLPHLTARRYIFLLTLSRGGFPILLHGIGDGDGEAAALVAVAELFFFVGVG